MPEVPGRAGRGFEEAWLLAMEGGPERAEAGVSRAILWVEVELEVVFW